MAQLCETRSSKFPPKPWERQGFFSTLFATRCFDTFVTLEGKLKTNHWFRVTKNLTQKNIPKKSGHLNPRITKNPGFCSGEFSSPIYKKTVDFVHRFTWYQLVREFSGNFSPHLGELGGLWGLDLGDFPTPWRFVGSWPWRLAKVKATINIHSHLALGKPARIFVLGVFPDGLGPQTDGKIGRWYKNTYMKTMKNPAKCGFIPYIQWD